MFEYYAMKWEIGLLIGFVGLAVGFAVKDRLQLRNRRGLSKEQFLQVFRKESIPDAIVSAVYDYYGSTALGDHVAISPVDDFETFRVGQDDRDDDLQRLLRKLAFDLPSSAVLKNSPHPLRTIGDVIRWLNWVRQHQTMQ